MERAKIVLRKARTYKDHNGRRWIKDVPQVIKSDSEIKLFEQNGYFHVARLKPVPTKKLGSAVKGKRLSTKVKKKKKLSSTKVKAKTKTKKSKVKKTKKRR